MVSVLVLKVVDHGFIAGVMVNVLVLKAVYRGFIGGVMVSVLVLKVVDRGFIGGRLACLSRKRYIAGSSPMNPRYTAFETSMLTRHR
jgi:hypothetical protein